MLLGGLGKNEEDKEYNVFDMQAFFNSVQSKFELF